MILTNTNPNPAWTNAMGPDGIRFPPGSWERGGGGYMGYGGTITAPMLPRWNTPRTVTMSSYPYGFDGYGLASGSPADQVMGDVIDAISRALAQLNAETLLSGKLTGDQKGHYTGMLVQPEVQLEALATGGRQSVLAGSESLDMWLAQAGAIVDQIKQASDVIDPSVSSFLDGVMSNATGIRIGPAIPTVVIVLGLAGAAFIGYKLLKK